MEIPTGWEKESEKITKKFQFNNFKEAVAFVNKVAESAESQGHHPDILIQNYKFVIITSTTHSEGKLTEKDINIVKKINEL
jgi:4a-hydroxytetrahydrobiopterin dehydratase